MVKLHSDSSYGDLPGTQGPQVYQDGTATITPQNALSPKNSLEQELPANKTVNIEGHINWLGSSYSGSDIKVVAHMYEQEPLHKQLSKLKGERDIASTVEDGSRQFYLSSSGLANLLDGPVKTYAAKRKAFISVTGISETGDIEKEAIRILMTRIFNRGDFTLTGLSKMRVASIKVTDEYQRTRRILDKQIIDLEKVVQDSLSTIVLGTLQTLSLQTHREKEPVRALGHSYVKGYCRGSRTIAGSMIFTIFDEHALLKLIRAMGRREAIWKDPSISSLLPDQLPPIDLTIVFANEYGSISELRIYGVEFINDGATYSIEDLLSEEILQFVARDCDVMTKLGNVRLSREQRGAFELDGQEKSASSLLFNNETYNTFLDKLSLRRSKYNR